MGSLWLSASEKKETKVLGTPHSSEDADWMTPYLVYKISICCGCNVNGWAIEWNCFNVAYVSMNLPPEWCTTTIVENKRISWKIKHHKYHKHNCCPFVPHPQCNSVQHGSVTQNKASTAEHGSIHGSISERNLLAAAKCIKEVIFIGRVWTSLWKFPSHQAVKHTVHLALNIIYVPARPANTDSNPRSEKDWRPAELVNTSLVEIWRIGAHVASSELILKQKCPFCLHWS